jgi:hypothetical protein
MMHVSKSLQEPSKGVDAARSCFMSSKRSIEALTVQPDFLAGGQLRDYQLDGINWLTYAWIKVRATASLLDGCHTCFKVQVTCSCVYHLHAMHCNCCYGTRSSLIFIPADCWSCVLVCCPSLT